MPEICLNVISYENGEIAPKVNVNNYRSLRNNCIESYIAAIDYKYYEYEHQLSRLVRGFNTFASATQTLLSAGAAGVGGSAGQILSGIGASIGTIRNGVDAEVLQNSTINAIVLQMAADRGETLKSILKQMQLDGPAPPLAGAPAKRYSKAAEVADRSKHQRCHDPGGGNSQRSRLYREGRKDPNGHAKVGSGKYGPQRNLLNVPGIGGSAWLLRSRHVFPRAGVDAKRSVGEGGCMQAAG
jgi:hypothetical protein